MLNKDNLCAKIVDELNHTVLCITYCKSIRTYLEDNIIITGNYVGLTKSVPPLPDPLNGPFQLKLTLSPTMDLGAKIKTALIAIKVAATPQIWFEALMSELQPGFIEGDNLRILKTPIIYQVSRLDTDSLKESRNYVDSWLMVSASTIETALSMNDLMKTPIPTTTTSGSGVTTISSIK